MSREKIYHAIILKKQPLGEGDELVTAYTRETGKLRLLAKSTKYAKSKLQYSLQTLFFVRLAAATARAGLPRLIGAETVKTFPRIRESLKAAKISFYCLELVLKFTPDEHKNEKLFNLLADFLNFLDGAAALRPEALPAGLAKFKINFLDCLGLGIRLPPENLSPSPAGPGWGFSNSRGGFLLNEEAADFRAVTAGQVRLFRHLRLESFDKLLNEEPAGPAGGLQQLLSEFLEYHLERDIKSEKFLSEQ